MSENDCMIPSRPDDPTHTWTVELDVLVHSEQGERDGYQTSETRTYTGTGWGLENFISGFVKDHFIGADDYRFEGKGTAISTTIRVEWTGR